MRDSIYSSYHNTDLSNRRTFSPNRASSVRRRLFTFFFFSSSSLIHLNSKRGHHENLLWICWIWRSCFSDSLSVCLWQIITIKNQICRMISHVISPSSQSQLSHPLKWVSVNYRQIQTDDFNKAVIWFSACVFFMSLLSFRRVCAIVNTLSFSLQLQFVPQEMMNKVVLDCIWDTPPPSSHTFPPNYCASPFTSSLPPHSLLRLIGSCLNGLLFTLSKHSPPFRASSPILHPLFLLESLTYLKHSNTRIYIIWYIII